MAPVSTYIWVSMDQQSTNVPQDGSIDTGVTTLSERLQRGDLFVEGCPSREVMRHVTSSWGTLVLIALQGCTMRFSALRRRINGVSERMLSQTLQSLERDGLLVRCSYPVVPPHTEYTLTDMGREAAVRVAALANWVEANVARLRPGT